MKISTRARIGGTLIVAAAAAPLITLATAAPAAEASSPTSLGTINGHKAFGIGPFDTEARCQPTADRLAQHGAAKFGSPFGSCIQRGGVWVAVSPWFA